MSSGCLKVVIDHKSDLSPSQESVVVSLSTLLFNTDSLLKRGIEDDLSQRRRNPRKSRNSLRPSIHCDVKKSTIDPAITTSLIHGIVS